MTGGRYASTTAPNKVFTSRDELAQHYKSDWHRYNLKRKEAGLAPVNEDDFNARLEAAMALRKEREGRDVRDGRDHLKDKNKKKEPKQQQQKKEANIPNNENPTNDNTNDEKMHDDEEHDSNTQVEEQPPEIDPLQSLFSTYRATTLDDVVAHMNTKYGFFIPDREYLVDLEGFLGYCAEKIKLGRMCLYCQKGFSSYEAVQRHMIAKGHCKVRYEMGVDLHEFEDFYDFSAANKEFLDGDDQDEKTTRQKEKTTTMDFEVINDDDDSGEWTDVEESDSDEFDGYEDVLKTHGFGVTELGELILPDGKIVGHRALSRYYNQSFRPLKNNNTAVAAQKRAERERYLGYGAAAAAAAPEGSSRTTDLTTVSGRMLQQARGRRGGGILVSSGGGGGGAGFDEFSKISVYRYRAAVRKERRDEGKGYRKKMRTFNNINRMDKKANRLMNGVSVAHAAR